MVCTYFHGFWADFSSNVHDYRWVPIWSWDRLNSWEMQDSQLFRLIFTFLFWQSEGFQRASRGSHHTARHVQVCFLLRKPISEGFYQYFGGFWGHRTRRNYDHRESSKLWSSEHGFRAPVSPKWGVGEFFGVGGLFTTLHYSPKHFPSAVDVCAWQKSKVQNRPKS